MDICSKGISNDWLEYKEPGKSARWSRRCKVR